MKQKTSFKKLSVITLICALSNSYVTIGQLTNTTGEPTTERSELITFYDKPVVITTKEGKKYSGTVRYKDYGEEIFYYLDEGSKTNEFVVITKDSGMDSISRIEITNKNKLASNENVIYIPVKTSEKATLYRLGQVVEENDAYIDFRFFQAKSNPFATGDQPAPENTSIPGNYDHFLFHARTNEFLRKIHLKSLSKNITTYVDYCPELTAKVEKKEKGYKQTLLLRDYDILKKVILEAASTCPE